MKESKRNLTQQNESESESESTWEKRKVWKIFGQHLEIKGREPDEWIKTKLLIKWEETEEKGNPKFSKRKFRIWRVCSGTSDDKRASEAADEKIGQVAGILVMRQRQEWRNWC